MSEELNEEIAPPEARAITPEFADAELLEPESKDDFAVDHELVDQAVQRITEIVSTNLTQAMIEVGKYLIKEFFNDDIQLAKQKKGSKEKSLHQVIEKLKSRGEKRQSKSWLYNAINLVVDSAALSDFHSYGNLPLSSKVLLLPVKDIEAKKELAEVAFSENLSACELKEKIHEGKKHQETSLLRFLKNENSIKDGNIEEIFTKFEILDLSGKKIKKVKLTIEHEIEELENMINNKTEILEKYKQIKSKVNDSSSKTKG